MGYCSSTVDLLQPPPATVHPASTAPSPATVQPALSMGSYSTTPPRAIVHPALHHLLFIPPSTGWSCSSSPPCGPVHPSPTGSIDQGHVHPEAAPQGPVHPPPLGTVHPNPPTTLTIHQGKEAAGFDRLPLAVVVKGSLGFS